MLVLEDLEQGVGQGALFEASRRFKEFGGGVEWLGHIGLEIDLDPIDGVGARSVPGRGLSQDASELFGECGVFREVLQPSPRTKTCLDEIALLGLLINQEHGEVKFAVGGDHDLGIQHFGKVVQSLSDLEFFELEHR